MPYLEKKTNGNVVYRNDDDSINREFLQNSTVGETTNNSFLITGIDKNKFAIPLRSLTKLVTPTSTQILNNPTFQEVWEILTTVFFKTDAAANSANIEDIKAELEEQNNLLLSGPNVVTSPTTDAINCNLVLSKYCIKVIKATAATRICLKDLTGYALSVDAYYIEVVRNPVIDIAQLKPYTALSPNIEESEPLNNPSLAFIVSGAPFCRFYADKGEASSNKVNTILDLAINETVAIAVVPLNPGLNIRASLSYKQN